MADIVDVILEFLKLNGTITDLEKDILDTFDKLVKQPSSREDVQKKSEKIIKNIVILLFQQAWHWVEILYHFKICLIRNCAITFAFN